MADFDSKGWIDHTKGVHLALSRFKQRVHVRKYCVSLSLEYVAYSVSKIGVSRLTELLVETLGRDPTKSGILINTVHTVT